MNDYRKYLKSRLCDSIIVRILKDIDKNCYISSNDDDMYKFIDFYFLDKKIDSKFYNNLRNNEIWIEISKANNKCNESTHLLCFLNDYNHFLIEKNKLNTISNNACNNNYGWIRKKFKNGNPDNLLYVNYNWLKNQNGVEYNFLFNLNINNIKSILINDLTKTINVVNSMKIDNVLKYAKKFMEI